MNLAIRIQGMVIGTAASISFLVVKLRVVFPLRRHIPGVEIEPDTRGPYAENIFT
jgi:hypothetical protein